MLLFNYSSWSAFEVRPIMCLCWFVSCVHLHSVGAVYLTVTDITMLFLHRWSQRTTRPWLPWPRPSPRMCCLLTLMTMREGTKCLWPHWLLNRFAQHSMWCERSNCVCGLWVHVCKLIKSWTGYCWSWSVLPLWPLCASVACFGSFSSLWRH